MSQEVKLLQKILVRKYLTCSKCNIFGALVVDPSVSNFICNYCHSYLKEISEYEYEKLQNIYKEKSNMQKNQQNENQMISNKNKKNKSS